MGILYTVISRLPSFFFRTQVSNKRKYLGDPSFVPGTGSGPDTVEVVKEYTFTDPLSTMQQVLFAYNFSSIAWTSVVHSPVLVA